MDNLLETVADRALTGVKTIKKLVASPIKHISQQGIERINLNKISTQLDEDLDSGKIDQIQFDLFSDALKRWPTGDSVSYIKEYIKIRSM